MSAKTVAAARVRVRTLKKQTTKKGKLLIHSRAKLRTAKKTLRRLIKKERTAKNPQGGKVRRQSRRKRRRRRGRRRRGGYCTGPACWGSANNTPLPPGLASNVTPENLDQAAKGTHY